TTRNSQRHFRVNRWSNYNPARQQPAILKLVLIAIFGDGLQLYRAAGSGDLQPLRAVVCRHYANLRLAVVQDEIDRIGAARLEFCLFANLAVECFFLNARGQSEVTLDWNFGDDVFAEVVDESVVLR